MNKNQLVVLLIIFVLVISAIFLYFVFRPNNQEELPVTETNDVNVVVDVDEISDLEDVIKSDDEIETLVKQQSQEIVHTKMQVTEKPLESPDTGVGPIAGIIALLVAIVFGFIAYKRNKKSEIFVN